MAVNLPDMAGKNVEEQGHVADTKDKRKKNDYVVIFPLSRFFQYIEDNVWFKYEGGSISLFLVIFIFFVISLLLS